MQSKKLSALESMANTVVGFTLSVLAGFIIFPLFGLETTPLDNLGIVLCFTTISFIRSYLIRRYFERKAR